MTGLIIKGVLILVALAAISYGVHVVLEHFREEGRQEQAAKDKPIIDGLTANLATSQANEATLKKTIADANLYVDQLQMQVKASKDRAAAAIAAAQQAAKATDAIISDLQARIAAPPIADFERACTEAKAVMDRLLASP